MSDIQATATQETPILQKVEVEVAASRVDKAFEMAYKDLAKTSQLKGFRRGKAPRSVLTRIYGAQVAEQLEQSLIQETIADAMETAEVEAVAPPAVDSSPPTPGAAFTYIAHVEVRPPIELPELDGLPGKRPAADVTDEEIEKELENLRERNAPVVEEPEGTEAENGHILSVDFVGKVGGEVFEGGTGRDVEIELGAGRFIPGFEEQLVGARADDDLEVNVTFPDEYQAEELAGKEASFAVHVAEVKKKQFPELDDEFAKDLGDFEKGTGSGADSIAPLAGIGWVPDDRNFIITLVQYFYSYDTDNAREEDVRETAPRLIWIRSLPELGSWFKADLKMSIDHEDDENFDQVLELQLGKMVSPSVGFYGEVFLGDDVLDSNAYNYSVGGAVRVMY